MIRGSRKRSKTESLGDELRAWRETHKLSQTAAANKLNVSPRTLQEWEQGRRTPRGLALMALRDKMKK